MREARSAAYGARAARAIVLQHNGRQIGKIPYAILTLIGASEECGGLCGTATAPDRRQYSLSLMCRRSTDHGTNLVYGRRAASMAGGCNRRLSLRLTRWQTDRQDEGIQRMFAAFVIGSLQQLF